MSDVWYLSTDDWKEFEAQLGRKFSITLTSEDSDEAGSSAAQDAIKFFQCARRDIMKSRDSSVSNALTGRCPKTHPNGVPLSANDFHDSL